jgi:hypothetical protein
MKNTVELLREIVEDEEQCEELKNPIPMIWLIDFEHIRTRD